MNTPAQILVELKSLQEELAQQEKACGLAARFCPGDLGNGLNEFSTFCLFTGGRLEAAIAQLEAVFDAGNQRDDQRVEQVICTFDADDLGSGVDQHQIEIRAMMKNGAFQKIAEITPESLDPDLFHRVFKILSAGQCSQSNVAPMP
ncbi:MAG: hypothetical protein AB7U29_03585 [Desulfobulbus sp.]